MTVKHSERTINDSDALTRFYDICDSALENGEIVLQDAGKGQYRYVYIKCLSITPRYKGNGTKFLRKLCKAADQYGINMELEVSLADNENEKLDLFKFYSKFGFYKIQKDERIMRRIAKNSKFCFKEYISQYQVPEINDGEIKIKSKLGKIIDYIKYKLFDNE